MSFLLQKIDRPRVTLFEVKSDRLIIGRGTHAHLRSDNAAMALEHAVIERREGVGYEIWDRGSITGTYVNGRPIERQTLAINDQIEIGDLVMTVQVNDPSRPLFLRVEKIRREEQEAESSASKISEP
ncbi:MAG: FHA domain-containing protein, partial [Thermoanaerobaculia bacterium]|nr:FHA domain-containing protein [Thermoanaerobaculia bacterium]